MRYCSVDNLNQGMEKFFNSNPTLRYLFFGGKGGVGKSVLASATAIRFSQRGKKSILVSTNPVHSLSSIFDLELFGEEAPIPGHPNLYVLEVDTKRVIERKKREIKEKIEWFLKFSDIMVKTDKFIDSAVMNPSFEESAMFEEMVDIIFRNEYEVYIFDTAPAANARRLLGMSSVYRLWVEKMILSKREAERMRRTLSYSEKEEKDLLTEYLIGLKDRIERIHKLLTDSSLTTFFFVTLPEALPISVVKRFIQWFKEFGIPIGGLIVNCVIEEDISREGTSEFVKNRIKMQEGYLKEIFSTFSDVRAVVPLLEKEVRGLEMLKRLSERLFTF